MLELIRHPIICPMFDGNQFIVFCEVDCYALLKIWVNNSSLDFFIFPIFVAKARKSLLNRSSNSLNRSFLRMKYHPFSISS